MVHLSCVFMLMRILYIIYTCTNIIQNINYEWFFLFSWTWVCHGRNFGTVSVSFFRVQCVLCIFILYGCTCNMQRKNFQFSMDNICINIISVLPFILCVLRTILSLSYCSCFFFHFRYSFCYRKQEISMKQIMKLETQEQNCNNIRLVCILCSVIYLCFPHL